MNEIGTIYHLHKMGVIDVDQVVTWADQKMMSIEPPYPDWLISISTELAGDPYIFERLIQEAEVDPSIDDSTFLSIVAGHFHIHSNEFEAAYLLYERFCTGLEEEINEMQKKIFLIDDELEWNVPLGRKHLEEFLSPHLDLFKQIEETIK